MTATHDPHATHCAIRSGWCHLHHSWRCGLAPRSPAEMRDELKLARDGLRGES